MDITVLFDIFIDSFTKEKDLVGDNCKVRLESVKNAILGYIEFYRRNYDKLDAKGKQELHELGELIFNIYSIDKLCANKARFYFAEYSKFKKMGSIEQHPDKKIKLLEQANKAYDEYCYYKRFKEEVMQLICENPAKPI